LERQRRVASTTEGFVKTIDELNRIVEVLDSTPLPRAAREWAGADVVVTTTPPPAPSEDSFYPEPRYVVTEYAFELSWLFEQLRDAFYAESRLDGCTKIEFFGRLANGANRCLRREPRADARLLCAAVLHEAFAIYDEMEEGSFECLAVALGNEIADDYIDDAMRSGFVGPEATMEFLRSRGLEVGDE
jgi:hypothetical protein